MKRITFVRHMLGAALLVGFLLLVLEAARSVPAALADQAEPTDPITIVENYLLARDSGDLWGAAGWCADLLELQDVDSSWFVDTAGKTDWLRQLTGRFMINKLSPLVLEGNVVSWTERLTPRGVFTGAAPRSIVVDVHAVIRAGKIAYISGPFPPIPVRSAVGLTGAPPPSANSSGPTPQTLGNGTATSSDNGQLSRSNTSVAPGTLFVGSAVALLAAGLLAARGGRAVVAVLQRTQMRSHSEPESCSVAQCARRYRAPTQR